MKKKPSIPLNFFYSLLFCGALMSCSSARKKEEALELEKMAFLKKMTDKQTDEKWDLLSKSLASVSAQLESLDHKLNLVLDKLHSTQSTPLVTLPNGPESQMQSNSSLTPSPSEDVESFQKGMILYQAGKFPEASLRFAQYVETFSDHFLAGSAQYFVGESYLNQKEYRLAIQEYKRVLSEYPFSTHVSDTLRSLSEAEHQLKLEEDSIRHLDALRNSFSPSPAANLENPVTL